MDEQQLEEIKDAVEAGTPEVLPETILELVTTVEEVQAVHETLSTELDEVKAERDQEREKNEFVTEDRDRLTSYVSIVDKECAQKTVYINRVKKLLETKYYEGNPYMTEPEVPIGMVGVDLRWALGELDEVTPE